MINLYSAVYVWQRISHVIIYMIYIIVFIGEQVMNRKNILKVSIFTLTSLLLVSFALSGCTPIEPDMVHHLNIQVKMLNKKTDRLSQKNVYLEQELHGVQLNLAKHGVQISGLNSKVSNIYGKYEKESHNLGILQKKFEEYRLIVNKKLVKLSKPAGIEPVLPKKAVVKKVEKTPPVKKENLTELDFKKAMSVYNKKNYTKAIKALNKFINKYPQSVYTADAFFYQAWANFNLKKYPVSILEFHKFSQVYPENRNVPMAIYLQGVGFFKVSDPSDAAILFRQVISKYSGTKAAELSAKALKGLSK